MSPFLKQGAWQRASTSFYRQWIWWEVKKKLTRGEKVSLMIWLEGFFIIIIISTSISAGCLIQTVVKCIWWTTCVFFISLSVIVSVSLPIMDIINVSVITLAKETAWSSSSSIASIIIMVLLHDVQSDLWHDWNHLEKMTRVEFVPWFFHQELESGTENMKITASEHRLHFFAATRRLKSLAQFLRRMRPSVNRQDAETRGKHQTALCLAVNVLQDERKTFFFL